MKTKGAKLKRAKTHEDYLRLPYARILMPEKEGGFTAEILEFPGCFAEGNTPQEAFANLEEAAKAWIVVARDSGQEIPSPSDARGWSGNVALRMPKGLHKRAAKFAERDRTSMNQWIISAVSEKAGAEDLLHRLYTSLVREILPKVQITINYAEPYPVGAFSSKQEMVTRKSGTPFTASTVPVALGVSNG